MAAMVLSVGVSGIAHAEEITGNITAGTINIISGATVDYIAVDDTTITVNLTFDSSIVDANESEIVGAQITVKQGTATDVVDTILTTGSGIPATLSGDVDISTLDTSSTSVDAITVDVVGYANGADDATLYGVSSTITSSVNLPPTCGYDGLPNIDYGTVARDAASNTIDWTPTASAAKIQPTDVEFAFANWQNAINTEVIDKQYTTINGTSGDTTDISYTGVESGDVWQFVTTLTFDSLGDYIRNIGQPLTQTVTITTECN